MSTRQYVVEIRTGDCDHAGTDAHVYLQMMGTMGVSGDHKLDNPNVNDFVRGQTDFFKIRDNDVGWINKIRLHHDNAKQHPGWFVDYVKIKYPDLGFEVQANYNRWLAKTEGDGSIDVTRDVLLPSPAFSGEATENRYLTYLVKRKRNDGPSTVHFADEFDYEYSAGLSVHVGQSVSTTTGASLSASFFGIGSSFEGKITEAMFQNFDVTTLDKFTHRMLYDADLAPGQAITTIALYYQNVFTVSAAMCGISVPTENKFAVTADPYVYSGVLTDAQVRQEVVNFLGYIAGAPVEPHPSGQAMNFRFGHKSLKKPVNAVSIARAREEMKKVLLSPARLAVIPRAKPLSTQLQIIKHR
ncbi:PLAT/LH2 domain-containing protein [Bradyrhizobium sp. SZCCHNRI1009]|uniref:PLAT/LH2 domain-containing protein n=1 Tax=Bradyrhizobium sp. SZCCHNRI1009 TaxID=3057277 RepID=UPI002916FC6D|nr:PLAT/LH2 domain-containing protein [Bradyrhizobium sp. SZCCHNRI1009]